MPSEIGQKCRTMVKKAENMSSPCIKITPVFPSDTEELAKLYYYYSEFTNKIQKKMGLPILVDIDETGAKEVQCPDSDNGYHEFAEFHSDSVKSNVLMCIHCGAFAPKTTRTEGELSEFFANKNFKKKEMPQAPEELRC